MTDRPIRTAMVLAAGFGTRLRPLTEHVPKPLIPIANGYLLDWILASLADAGVERVAVNTHHLAEQVERHLRVRHQGLDVTVFREHEILGTGGALANARPVLERDERFLLVNGDVLCDPDFGALAAALSGGAEAALVLHDVPRINTVRLGAGGLIRDVAGLLDAPPADGDAMLTYTGVAAFRRSFLERLPEGRSELAPAFCRALRDDPASVRGLRLPGDFWHDLGTPARYLEAQAEFLLEGDRVHRGPGVSVSKEARLSGFACLYDGCRVDAGVELDDCVVMPGVRVRGPASHHRAVIGDGWVMPARPPAPAGPPRELWPLLAEAGATEDAVVAPVTGQASDRLFWRVSEGEGSMVVTDAREDPVDFDRFVEIAGFLHEHGFGGPRVLASDPKRPALAMEDLGADSLGDLVARGGADPFDVVFDRLLDLQIRGTALVRDGACPALADRDFLLTDLMHEQGYFASRFLMGVCGLDEEDVLALEPECVALAQAVAEQPLVLMHRDFQSTNILLSDGEVKLVDVQGMRLGPRGYDPASLIRDPYLDTPPDRALELLDRYAARAAVRHGVDAAAVRRETILAGVQRNMQALGAYGFLTRIRGKRAYRRWIVPGLRQLAAGLADLATLDGAPALPRLADLVAALRDQHEHLDPDRQ